MSKEHKNDYILGIWFVDSPGYGNMQIFVKKGDKTNEYIKLLNFRKYKDQKIFDSEDDRTRLSVTFSAKSEEDAIDLVRIQFERILKLPGCPFNQDSFKDELIVQGDAHKMADLSKNTTWLHVKMEKIH